VALEAGILKISNGRAQERHLFLMDKMLVYAKESAVKKKFFQLKGRIPLNQFTVESVEANSPLLPNGLCEPKFAWKVTRKDIRGGKTYFIINKSLKDKSIWIEEILRAQGNAEQSNSYRND
jgi:hypothetical protein